MKVNISVRTARATSQKRVPSAPRKTHTCKTLNSLASVAKPIRHEHDSSLWWRLIRSLERTHRRRHPRGDAGAPAKKNAKKWTPPPWDERPLRKSDKKSQGVTNPYASKPTKARVTARR